MSFLGNSVLRELSYMCLNGVFLGLAFGGKWKDDVFSNLFRQAFRERNVT